MKEYVCVILLAFSTSTLQAPEKHHTKRQLDLFNLGFNQDLFTRSNLGFTQPNLIPSSNFGTIGTFGNLRTASNFGTIGTLGTIGSVDNLRTDLGTIGTLGSLNDLGTFSNFGTVGSLGLNNLGIGQLRSGPPVVLGHDYHTTITRHLGIPVSQPYAVPVHRNVGVPVRIGVPVAVDRPVPVAVPQPVGVAVDRPVPIRVDQPFAVPIPQPVAVPLIRQVGVGIPQPMAVGISPSAIAQQGLPSLQISSAFPQAADAFQTLPQQINVRVNNFQTVR